MNLWRNWPSRETCCHAWSFEGVPICNGGTPGGTSAGRRRDAVVTLRDAVVTVQRRDAVVTVQRRDAVATLRTPSYIRPCAQRRDAVVTVQRRDAVATSFSASVVLSF